MPPNSEAQAAQDLQEKLNDRFWRLNNLYYITDKGGNKVLFRMNWAQRQLYKSMWYLNVVLKARQLGMSTFILIFMLDMCLFNKNVRAGVIAHTKDDVKVLFRDKIKFAFDNLDPSIRNALATKADRANELLFANNSSIRVGTSMRSGTLQILHVSEFGKICNKYPEKAREIVTGSFETVHAGQMIFVESTAEGREGRFYDMCIESKRLHDVSADLSPLDFKLFFLPWWEHPENVLEPDNVVVFPYMREYFAKLGAMGIRLTLGQKAWYVKKWLTLGEDIKREHPSTFSEAFEWVIEGAYYSRQIKEARREGRISKVPHQSGYTVDTWWDLGVNDSTVIWFTQRIGDSCNVIDYYENNDVGLEHYVDVLDAKGQKMGYRYGFHVFPHDGNVREIGTGTTRQEAARNMGLNVTVMPRTKDLGADIEQTRQFFQLCSFDEEKCDEGLKGLENYRKEWDEHKGVWKDRPLHDWASHPADGFRNLAVNFRKVSHPVHQRKSARPITKARYLY